MQKERVIKLSKNVCFIFSKWQRLIPNARFKIDSPWLTTTDLLIEKHNRRRDTIIKKKKKFSIIKYEFGEYARYANDSNTIFVLRAYDERDETHFFTDSFWNNLHARLREIIKLYFSKKKEKITIDKQTTAAFYLPSTMRDEGESYKLSWTLFWCEIIATTREMIYTNCSAKRSIRNERGEEDLR